MIFEAYYFHEWHKTLVLPPKCASTSVKDAVIRTFKPEDERLFWAQRRVQETKGEVVSIVRNPYDRVVSCYLNKIKGKYRFKEFRFPRGNDFNKFIDFLCSDLNPEKPFNVHWTPLYPYINNSHTILRLEDPPNVWHNLRQIIPIEPMNHLNRTNDRPNYRKFYKRQKTFNRVTEYYKADLEEFGYTF